LLILPLAAFPLAAWLAQGHHPGANHEQLGIAK
jgi:hypothetical protein